MENTQRPLRGFPLTVNVYARDEQEVETARKALAAFIDGYARHGRAVTAEKVARAASQWESNPVVRARIIRYFT